MRLVRCLTIVLAISACNSARDKERELADMQERGRQVMGVDQYASAHVFEDLPDGGRIILEMKDASDTAAIAAIRRHMQDIQVAFRAGDFAKPFEVHAMTVPGTDLMRSLRDSIGYEASDRPLGGEVRIRATQPAAITAIHQFLAFQRDAHHAARHAS
jgi:hypothetical protein